MVLINVKIFDFSSGREFQLSACYAFYNFLGESANKIKKEAHNVLGEISMNSGAVLDKICQLSSRINNSVQTKSLGLLHFPLSLITN